jgi:hypothetical protein
MMATLLRCIDCGKVVSSHASQCPHCQSRYPLGVKCTVCCQILKKSEALQISKDYGKRDIPKSVKFFHPSCYHQVNQIRTGKTITSCPACQASIEFDTSSWVICNNCGHEFSTQLQDPDFASCCYCGFRLNKNLEVKVKDISRQLLDGWITETLYAHKICYTQERRDQERISQLKERAEQERIKKIRGASKQNKQSERNIETLLLSISIGLPLGIIFGGLGGVIAHFMLGFSSSWQSAALLGFAGIFLVTIGVVWILSLFE